MRLSDLIGDTWADQMKGYLEGQDFHDLGMFISSLKYDVIPSKKDIFTSFKEVPYDKVRVVIIGQRPYRSLNKAIGRAFGINVDTTHGTISKSLSDIVEQIIKEEGLYLDPDHSLKGWSDQGVFLINRSMTCTLKEDHHEQWDNFILECVKALSKKNDVIFLFIGDDNGLRDHIGSGNYRIHADDFNNDVLSKINAMFYLLEQKEIKWNITNYS
jgi:uracil-DNA glycosylase